MVRTLTKTRPKSTASDLAVLEAIQKRLLWLGTNIVHHANNVRENTDGTKVGGHQASTASSVSILTAVYFSFLKAGDRVAIKPHSSPAYHAIQYLLGNLDRKYLPTLREFGGLQAYPSRSKDPDPVDFSLGSMGLGAAAPSFAALAERYTRLHFGGPSGRRFVALLGDAELDEGNVWEAVTESHLSDLGNLTWVIDLNRQSLDRVVPGIRARQLKALFRDSNWNVIETKFGRRLRAAFSRAGGEALKRRIDNMTNPEYQAIIRLKGPECRAQMIDGADDANGVRRALADVPDNEVPALLSDLGGHDLGDLIAALAEADAETARPSVIFAYTIKGWGLPMAAHPLNHSALMNAQQMEDLAKALEIPPDDEWAGFEPDSPEGRLCAEVAERLREPEQTGGLPLNRDDIPISVDHQPLSNTSSQATLGLLLMDLSRIPAIANRIVTTTPDVAVSTNLGGWINKVGVYQATADKDYESGPLPVKWDVTPTGQHIELGISEMNLFVLLEQLGLSHELAGELLLPIGDRVRPLRPPRTRFFRPCPLFGREIRRGRHAGRRFTEPRRRCPPVDGDAGAGHRVAKSDQLRADLRQGIGVDPAGKPSGVSRPREGKGDLPPALHQADRSGVARSSDGPAGRRATTTGRTVRRLQAGRRRGGQRRRRSETDDTNSGDRGDRSRGNCGGRDAA